MNKIKQISIFALFLFAPAVTFAGDYYTGSSKATIRGDAAIKGYDVVAYFKENKAVKGSADFSYEHDGAVWRFASAENLNDFKASPARYAPKYGGYCAYAMSSYGKKVKVDPTQFTVKDDKLYLNFNARFSTKFKNDIDKHITQADENWEKFPKH